MDPQSVLQGPTIAAQPSRWRPMTAADLDEVVEIEQASRPSPWSRTEFEADLY